MFKNILKMIYEGNDVFNIAQSLNISKEQLKGRFLILIRTGYLKEGNLSCSEEKNDHCKFCGQGGSINTNLKLYILTEKSLRLFNK